MARRVSYESSGFSLGSIVPYAVIGGIGYYLYHNWDSIASMIPSFQATPKTVRDVAAILPASWAGVTQAANEAANASQIKYNQDYANAIRANNAVMAERIRLEALKAQVIIGNPRDPRTPVNCLQPNFIKDGECVDPFTLRPVALSGGDLGRIVDIDAFLESTRALRKGNFR